jgi:hypothetical protein
MRQLFPFSAFLLISTLLMAQSGPDRAYQDQILSVAKAPYMMSDGRLLYVTEHFSSLVNSSPPEGSVLHCVRDNNELWQYQLADSAFLADYQIVEMQDGSIIVTFWRLGECARITTPEITWIKFANDGTLIERIQRPFTELIDPNKFFISKYIIDPIRKKTIFILSGEAGSSLLQLGTGQTDTLEHMLALPFRPEVANGTGIIIDTIHPNTMWLIGNQGLYKIVDNTIQDSVRYNFNVTQFFPQGIAMAPDGSTISVYSFNGIIHTYAITPEGIGDLIAQTTITNTYPIQLSTLSDGSFCAFGVISNDNMPILSCFRWPSATSLGIVVPQTTQINLNSFIPDIVPTIDYVLLLQISNHFPISESGFDLRTTGEIRRYTWGTGAPIMPYPDVVLESVVTAPDTWGYTFGQFDEFTYINCSGGGTVTIFNKGNSTIQSLVLSAFFERSSFADNCSPDRQMRRRFDNLNLASGQRIQLPLDPFINEATITVFGITTSDKPSIIVWASAPNDLPDANTRDNGLVVTDFFNERTAPGTFNIFPNPVSGDYLAITIVPEDLIQARFRIFNMLGQLVSTPVVVNTEEYYFLPVHDLPKGVYYLTIGEESRLFMRN